MANRMIVFVSGAALVVGSLVVPPAAEAGPVGGGIGGAIIGGILGDIVGGRDGAAWGATIGAGSTITKDAPADALTVSRARQANIKGWKRPRKDKDK